MDAIRPVSTPPPTAPVVPPVRPVSPSPAGTEPQGRALEPAVSVDVSAREADAKSRTDERRGFVRDADSRSLVFQVTDARTGDVVIQIPDIVVLKARAYAREAEEPVGERLALSA